MYEHLHFNVSGKTLDVAIRAITYPLDFLLSTFYFGSTVGISTHFGQAKLENSSMRESKRNEMK